MQRNKNTIPTLTFTTMLMLLMPLAQAAPKQIILPPETAKLRKSELPGYTLATQQCLICHSADYINFQPPGMNQQQWTDEVFKMQHSYGARFSEADARSIGAYLAVAYGSAKATDASIIAASTPEPVVETPTANASIDVPALLNSNACLSCHAIDKQLVGPAFHEIALKYKSATQAQSKLATVIQQGSVGKWGEIPMPAMVNLSDTQANALAAFVLKQ
jgi:cytochrome c551/c552